MPNGLFNWTFNDIEKFLKKNNFVYNYSNASHYYYRGFINKEIRKVCVPYHGKKALKPKTVKGIILQSGIDQKKWTGKN